MNASVYTEARRFQVQQSSHADDHIGEIFCEIGNYIYRSRTVMVISTMGIPLLARQRTVRMSANGKTISEALQVPRRSFIRLLAEF